jgi:hypothetical protein
MVEEALSQQHLSASWSEVDENARREAAGAEARTGLPRAGNGEPPLDRETAMALVEAGYMPLADYVALYGEVAAQDTSSRAQQSLTGQLAAAFPRRPMYHATSIRCTFAKPTRRLAKWERKLAKWERRAAGKSRQA